jgi:hypothetical protein
VDHYDSNGLGKVRKSCILAVNSTEICSLVASMLCTDRVVKLANVGLGVDAIGHAAK